MTTAEQFWRQRARHVAWRVNFAWWWNTFAPALFGLSLALTCALLLARRAGAELRGWWLVYVAAVATAGVVSLALGRRRFLSATDGLVRLEAVLHLHNRLTAAATGIGAWPAPMSAAPDGYQWRWRAVLWSPVLATALLVAAMRVPIPLPPAAVVTPQQEPLAWSQAQSWLEQLRQEELVAEPAVERLEEQLAQLRAQPREEWYQHSSLEAGDSLRQEVGQSLRALDRDMERAAQTLAAWQAGGIQMPDAQQRALAEQWQRVMEGVQNGTLPLHPDLLKQLQQVDPQQLQQLTPEQMQALQQLVENAQQALAEMRGAGAAGSQQAEGEEPGVGGITRGPGAAPLTMSQPTDLATQRTETLPNTDPSQAAPGDVVETTTGAHKVNEGSYPGATAAGAVQSYGVGGEAVWRNPLPPAERKILQQYFK